MKEREYLFSNFKAFLIITVVFGHFVQCMSDSVLRDFLMFYIYSFHMPAFIFVSGYFSKNVEKGNRTAFEKYFIPFLYMSVIYIIINAVISHSMYVRFIVPVFAAWYVLVIFYYKLIMKWISKIPAKIVFPCSVIIAMLAGLVPFIGASFCLQRTLSFFPLFLAGYYLKKEQIAWLKSKVSAIVAAVLLVVIAAVYIGYVLVFHFDYQPFLCNTPFTHYGFSWWQGMLFRLFLIAISLVFTFLFLILFQEKKYRFSYIGDNTMSVYALHCIGYLIVKKTGLLANMSVTLALIVSLVLTAVVVLVLSIPKINHAYMSGIGLLTRLEKKYVLVQPECFKSFHLFSL